MDNENLDVEDILDRLDADPVEKKHQKMDQKLDEIQDQIEFLQDQFPTD